MYDGDYRMTDIKERVVRIISEVSRASLDDMRRTVRFADIEKWDSLMHLSVVLALEKEFGIKFAIEELTNINSVDEAVALIAKKRTVA